MTPPIQRPTRFGRALRRLREGKTTHVVYHIAMKLEEDGLVTVDRTACTTAGSRSALPCTLTLAGVIAANEALEGKNPYAAGAEGAEAGEATEAFRPGAHLARQARGGGEGRRGDGHCRSHGRRDPRRPDCGRCVPRDPPRTAMTARDLARTLAEELRKDGWREVDTDLLLIIGTGMPLASMSDDAYALYEALERVHKRWVESP